jgi:hypothetical protein
VGRVEYFAAPSLGTTGLEHSFMWLLNGKNGNCNCRFQQQFMFVRSKTRFAFDNSIPGIVNLAQPMDVFSRVSLRCLM